MWVKVGIFSQSLPKGIHIVPLSCSKEEWQNGCVKKGKRKSWKRSSDLGAFLTSAELSNRGVKWVWMSSCQFLHSSLSDVYEVWKGGQFDRLTSNSEEAHWLLAPNYIQITYKFTKKTPSTSWCFYLIGVYSDVLVSFGSQWFIYSFTVDAILVIKKLLIFYQSSQTWISFHLFLVPSHTFSSLLLCASNVMGWARTGYDLCVINANFLGPRGNFLVISSHFSKALHRDTCNYLPFSPAFMLSILC